MIMNFGDPRLPERFWSKLIPEPNSGCWLWLGSTAKGRGEYKGLARSQQPYRIVYEIAMGSVPKFLGNTCGGAESMCCNPEHMTKRKPRLTPEQLAKKRERTRMRMQDPEFRARQKEGLRRWHQENRERALANSKAWKAANPEKHQLHLRRHWFKRKYGLTLSQIEKMIEEQGNACAICRQTFGTEIVNKPNVDHCHATGVIRGLLCGRCNTGLGQFRDADHLLLNALAYLKKSREEG